MGTRVPRIFRATLSVVVALLLLASFSQGALAGGVVGTGTPDSCTEAALNAALGCGAPPVSNCAGGGTVTFNCGGAATITVTSTKTISADTTIDGGGVITISGGNSVGVFSVNTGVKFTVQNLTIANSKSASLAGGAIYNGGTLTVTNSTFSGNSAIVGGGIYNGGGTLTVTNSTFSGNSADNGGGINNNSGGTLTVTNSTFSGNSSPFGGGIYTGGGKLTVTNSTFSGNSSPFGGGIYNNGTVTVTNTIVANSIKGGNCYGTVTDGGHNIDDGTTCGFTGTGCTATTGTSFCNTNPVLDPTGLQNNGGPTQTIALQAVSPAINAGNEAVCAAPPVNNLDQRGVVRPGTGATSCSIGAYEYWLPCCQCPTSCAAPVNGLCGDCTVVVGATCESGSLCVLNTPTPSPTPTSPGTNDCCQCADFCAAPIVGTCGGCTVVFGASCTGGSLCVPRTATPTPTETPAPTPVQPTPTPTCPPCKCLGSLSVEEPQVEPSKPAVGDLVTFTFGVNYSGAPGGCCCGAWGGSGSCEFQQDDSLLDGDERPARDGYTVIVRRRVAGAGVTTVQLQVSAITEDECYNHSPSGCQPYWAFTCRLEASSPPFRLELAEAPSPTPTPTLTATPTATEMPTDTPTDTPTGTPTDTPIPTSTPTRTPTETAVPTPTVVPCVGDCNGDGTVPVNEILTLVNIALGNADATACPNGIPSGAQVDVALILTAVNNALNGCQ
jgi:predicted outer membrane repeat protein